MPKHFNYDELLPKEELEELYINQNLRKKDISELKHIKIRTLE